MSSDKFACLQEKDEKMCALWEKVTDGLYSDPYFIQNGIVYRSIIDNGHKFEAAVVPQESTDTVLYLGHNQSGHNGYQRTYAAIKCVYYWKGMRKHVLAHCKSCVTCAKQKVKKPQFEKQIFEPGVQPMESSPNILHGNAHAEKAVYIVDRYHVPEFPQSVITVIILFYPQIASMKVV